MAWIKTEYRGFRFNLTERCFKIHSNQAPLRQTVR